MRARRTAQALGQGAQDGFVGFAPMAAQDRGEHLLFVAREAGQIGILDDVRAVQMMLAVRDGQADLVDARGPRQPVALARCRAATLWHT